MTSITPPTIDTNQLTQVSNIVKSNLANNPLGSGISGLGFTPSTANINKLIGSSSVPDLSNIGSNMTQSLQDLPGSVLSQAKGLAGNQINNLNNLGETVTKNIQGAGSTLLSGSVGDIFNNINDPNNTGASSFFNMANLAQDLNVSAPKLPPSLPISVPNTSAEKQATTEQTTQNSVNDLYEPLVWAPNVLSAIDQPAYKFRLFMTDDRAIPLNLNSIQEVMKELQGRPSITLAETGTTGINIKNVNIDSIVAPGFRNRNTTAVSIVITLQEPMGVSLLDQIIDSAEKLGVRNYAKSFYYLELRFHGYNTNGDYDENPCRDFNSGGRWLWQLSIIDIESQLSSGGGTYTFTCIPFDDKAITSEYMHVAETITPTGRTIRDMFNNLFDQLNTNVQNRYGFQIYKYNPPIFKDFEYYGQQYNPGDFSVAASKPDSANQRPYSFAVNNGAITGHFVKETKITDMFDYAFMSSETAQALAKGGLPQDSTDSTNRKLKESVVFKITSTVEQKQYEPTSARYILDITFVVYAYKTYMPVISEDQKEDAEDPRVQRQTLQEIRQSKKLIKRYDYLFTGLNTEVEHFDIKYNLNWTAVLPYIQGLRGSIDQATIAAKPNLTLQVRSLQDQLNDVNDNIKKINEEIDKADSKINKPDGTPVSRQDPQSNFFKDADRVTNLNNFQERQDALKQQITATTNETIIQSETQKALALGSLNKIPFTNERYSEDLILVPNSVKTVIPISLRQEYLDANSSTVGAVGASAYRDASVFGAILNQLYGSQTDKLQIIQLQIKGDPYWVGLSNLESRVYITDSTSYKKAKATSSLPIWLEGDNLLYLTFKYPQGFDETGAPIIKNQDAYNAIYQVIKVSNVFGEGKFSQTLEALRIPLIDVIKAFSPPGPGENITSTSRPNSANRTASGNGVNGGTLPNGVNSGSTTPGINNQGSASNPGAVVGGGTPGGPILSDDVINKRPGNVGLAEIDRRAGDLSGLSAQEALTRTAQASEGTTTGIGFGGVPDHPCDWAARNTFAPVLERDPDPQSQAFLTAMGNGGAANQMNAVIAANGGSPSFQGSASDIAGNLAPGQVLYTGGHVLYTANDQDGNLRVFDGQIGQKTPGRAVQSVSADQFVNKWKNSGTNFKAVQVVRN